MVFLNVHVWKKNYEVYRNSPRFSAESVIFLQPAGVHRKQENSGKTEAVSRVGIEDENCLALLHDTITVERAW